MSKVIIKVRSGEHADANWVLFLDSENRNKSLCQISTHEVEVLEGHYSLIKAAMLDSNIAIIEDIFQSISAEGHYPRMGGFNARERQDYYNLAMKIWTEDSQKKEGPNIQDYVGEYLTGSCCENMYNIYVCMLEEAADSYEGGLSPTIENLKKQDCVETSSDDSWYYDEDSHEYYVGVSRNQGYDPDDDDYVQCSGAVEECKISTSS